MNSGGRRTRRSASEWAQIVAEWKRSGLSGVTFAEEHDLCAASLYTWAKKLQQRGTPKASSEFVAVDVVDEPALESVVRSGMELVTRSGRRIRIGSHVDRDVLAMVLEVAEQC